LIDIKKYEINKVENIKENSMSILAIGSHPDDIEIGCGGALHKFVKNGHKVAMLIMTRGEIGGDPDIREKEFINSAKILGVEEIFIAPFKDTEIPLNKDIIKSIEDVVKYRSIDMVFVNFPDDTHQDHRITANCVISATRYVKNLLFFEVPSTQNFSPEIFVDVGEMMDIKREALLAHESQVDKVNISDLSILDCAVANAVFRGVQSRVKYAEAFKAQRYFINI